MSSPWSKGAFPPGRPPCVCPTAWGHPSAVPSPVGLGSTPVTYLSPWPQSWWPLVWGGRMNPSCGPKAWGCPSRSAWGPWTSRTGSGPLTAVLTACQEPRRGASGLGGMPTPGVTRKRVSHVGKSWREGPLLGTRPCSARRSWWMGSREEIHG